MINLEKSTKKLFDLDVVPPPYHRYRNATVYESTDGRKYIRFKNLNNEVKGFISPSMTTYARYLYQVQYWQEQGEWIPDGYEVDHINDDCTDDRLNNYQLLTREQNQKKQDYKRFKNNPPHPTLLSLIGSLLRNGATWNDIATTALITVSYLRYVVSLHFPNFLTEDKLERNIDDMYVMVQNGRTFEEIAMEYGVSVSTISRIVNKHFPELTRSARAEKMVEAIRVGLMEGKTNRQLARELNCTDGNIIFYVKTYLPELRSKLNHRKQLAKDLRRLTIEKMLNEGKTADEISAIIGLSRRVTVDLIVKLFPERNKFTVYEKNAETICSLYKDGKTIKEIVDITGITYGNVTQTVKRELPDLFYARSAERENARVQRLNAYRSYLDRNMSAEEIVAETGEKLSTVLCFVRNRFADHPNVAGKWTFKPTQDYYRNNPDALPDHQKTLINQAIADGKSADDIVYLIAKTFDMTEKHARAVLLRHYPNLSKKSIWKGHEQTIKALHAAGKTAREIALAIGTGKKIVQAIIRRLTNTGQLAVSPT